MGLFDKIGKIGKKTCSICGKDTGLLSRKKLADGYLCNDCKELLSPFWNPTRATTVEQVQQHLSYRKQNKEALKDFHPTDTIGDARCILIDRTAGTFVLTTDDEQNPDLFELSQIQEVNFDIYEDDITSEDSDGDSHHDYYEYSFYLVVELDNPQIKHVRFRINEHPIKNRGKRIKQRDAEKYYRGEKEIKGGLFSFSNRDDTIRYMEWYSELQDMIAALKDAAA